MEKLHYHVDILCSCDSLEDYERIFNFSVKLWTSVVTPSLQYHSSWCIHLNLPYMRMPVHIYLIKWTLVGLKKTFFCKDFLFNIPMKHLNSYCGPTLILSTLTPGVNGVQEFTLHENSCINYLLHMNLTTVPLWFLRRFTYNIPIHIQTPQYQSLKTSDP